MNKQNTENYETVKYYFMDFVRKGGQNSVAFFYQKTVFLWEKNAILQTDMEFVKKNSRPHEPKKLRQNAYFAIFANLPQKCVNALKWNLINEKHFFSNFADCYNMSTHILS